MRHLLVAALLAAALAAAGLQTASASCMVPPSSAQADAAPLVFVGTVQSTSNGDRVARVKVESVWRGGPVPTLVTVAGTPAEGSVATSVDRKFTPGVRYLFVPTNASSPFQDNSCTATRPYEARMDSLRPADAQPPRPGSDGLQQPAEGWLNPWLAGAAVLLAAGLGAWLFTRRRRARSRLTP